MAELRAASLVLTRGGGPFPCAEILVGSDDLIVTVPLPNLRPDHLDVVVAGKALQIRSGRKSHGSEFLVPLPARVMPGRATFTYRNGVLDARLLREPRAEPDHG